MKNRRFSKYGPWAVVSGASSGIGKEIALLLHQKGLNIVLVARSEERLLKVASTMEQNKTLIVVANLATESGIEKLEEETSSLDIGLFVHSAGAVHVGPFVGMSALDLDELLQVHVNATTQLAHLFATRLLQRRNGGGIVLVSSGFALTPVPWIATYAATKAYVLSLGEAMATEMRKDGIDVLTLIPGATKTEMSADIERYIDLEKLPLPMGTATSVAKSAINSLGRRDSVVPGLVNKVMAIMMDRIMGRRMSKALIGIMLGRAFRRTTLTSAGGSQK